MEITIDEAIKHYEDMKKGLYLVYPEELYDFTIATMRKYQKIEDIYYHQTGRALEDSLRSVIEDGNT